MWSLGVMVMEMIEKDPPYMGMPPTRVLFNILKKGLPDLKVFISLPLVLSFFDELFYFIFILFLFYFYFVFILFLFYFYFIFLFFQFVNSLYLSGS